MIPPIELSPLSTLSLSKSVTIPAGARQQVVFILTNQDKQPITLTAEPVNSPAAPAVYGAEPVQSEMTSSVQLLVKTGYSLDDPTIINIIGTILNNGCPGAVEFVIDGDMTTCPGTYRAEIGLFSGTFLTQSWPIYLIVAPTLFNRSMRAGPPTIPEVRMGIGDIELGEVSLLDTLEFSDAEIIASLNYVIDIWNETPPNVAYFDGTNFPYRYHWIQGAVAQLYKMAVRKYARNQLNYSAGGVTIDDQNKQMQYTAIYKEVNDEFRTWMMNEKRRINTELAWSIGI